MGRRKSFTLIELLVVVALVGILATIAVPNYQRFQHRAKLAEAKYNLGAIREYLHTYYMDYATYIVCPMHPPSVPRATTVLWDDEPVPQAWIDVGFWPVGRIRYAYEVEAGPGGIGSSYIAVARGDLDGNGIESEIRLDQSGNMTAVNSLE